MTGRNEFIKLQTASFLSQSGSHFLTIALSAFVLQSSKSIVHASLVFVLSYLPSVFFSAKLGAWIDRHLSKWLLARNELLSILSSALCGVVIYYQMPLVFLCIVLSLRSILLFIARTGGSKWIKLISPPEKQASRIKFFFLGFFLSTAVAGMLAGVALGVTNILMVVAIDIATYVASFLVILTFQKIPTQSRGQTLSALDGNLIDTLREISKNPALWDHFVSVCLSQAIFQGAYSVLVSYLPMVKFHQGPMGVGPYQIAASIGITIGFLILWAWPRLFITSRQGLPLLFISTLGGGAVALLLSVASSFLSLSLLSFVALNIAYECIWLFHNSEFFRKTDASQLGRYQFTLAAIACSAMTLFTLGYATLMTFFNPLLSVALIVAIGVSGWWAFHKGGKSPEKNFRFWRVIP